MPSEMSWQRGNTSQQSERTRRLLLQEFASDRPGRDVTFPVLSSAGYQYVPNPTRAVRALRDDSVNKRFITAIGGVTVAALPRPPPRHRNSAPEGEKVHLSLPESQRAAGAGPGAARHGRARSHVLAVSGTERPRGSRPGALTFRCA